MAGPFSPPPFFHHVHDSKWQFSPLLCCSSLWTEQVYLQYIFLCGNLLLHDQCSRSLQKLSRHMQKRFPVMNNPPVQSWSQLRTFEPGAFRRADFLPRCNCCRSIGLKISITGNNKNGGENQMETMITGTVGLWCSRTCNI